MSPIKYSDMRPDVINGLNLYSFRRNSPNRPKVVNIANNGTKRLSPELSLPDIPISSSNEIHYTLGAPDENLLNMQLFGEILQLAALAVSFVSDNIERVDKSAPKGLKFAGRILGVADVVLQGVVSAYSNFNNESLSIQEQWIGFGEDLMFDILPNVLVNWAASAIISKTLGVAMASCPPLLTVAVTTVAVVAVAAILIAIFNHVSEERQWREKYRATAEAYV